MNLYAKYVTWCEWLYSKSTLLAKIRPWHLFVLSFLLSSVFMLLRMPSNILLGDEIFYYFQAEGLTHLQLLWFENTQPYIYPLVLAPFIMLFGKSLFFMRLFSALLIACSSVLVYSITKKFFDARTAALAALLFLLHAQTVKMGASLLTETVFMPLMLVSMLLFYMLSEKKTVRTTILLGIVMGASILTRLTGAFLFVYYLALSFFFHKNEFKKTGVAIGIGLVLFASFLLLGGHKIIVEKVVNEVFSASFYESVYWYSLAYLGLGTLLLLLAGFFAKIHVTGKQQVFMFEVKFAIVLYVLLVLIISKYLTERYFFFIFPFIAILSAVTVLHAEKKDRPLFVALVLVFACISASTFATLGPDFGNQYYFDRTNCVNVQTFGFAEDQLTDTITLPYFNQPSNSARTYVSTVLLDSNYTGLFISYVSDQYVLSIDGNVHKQGNSVFVPVRMPYAFTPGKHIIAINVYNSDNIGGIGQVLICK